MTPAGIETLERRPIKGEIFGAARLGSHARRLARRHTLAPAARPRSFHRRDRGPLIAQLDATERTLSDGRETLAAASVAGADVGPAGAWLLDNFFVVIEQLPEIRATMPAGYYRELPKLSGDGPRAGYPRIYDIILELITHTDGRLDEASVALILAEYQRVSALTLGELWAVPAMLRIGYLENVRRMAVRAARDVADRAAADAWVSRLIAASPSDVDDLSAFVHRGPNLTPAFLTRFLQQIRSRRSDFMPLLWLEQWLAEDVMTVEDAAHRSAQELALTQLVMANSIASLRHVANIDWTTIVEAASVVEATLRDGPMSAYAQMTRATRDQYRHAVERIARGAKLDEGAVAAAAVRAARTVTGDDEADIRRRHVGHYLVGEGRRAFERGLGFRADGATRIREWILEHPSASYFGTLSVVFAATLAVLLSPLLSAAPDDRLWWLVVVAALACLAAADAAVAIVHQIVNLVIPASRLPRLDYADSVPEQQRTIVVVPLLLGSAETVTRALDHIEAQFLANRDREIRFALLGDYLDSANEHARMRRSSMRPSPAFGY